jgi:hypothetical protein
VAAFHPGVFERNGVPEFLCDCQGVQVDDPYGLVSGSVSDCISFASAGESPVQPRTHSSAGIRVIVKGGNADDSLPVFYQPRARYNLLTLDQGSGFRCVLR